MKRIILTKECILKWDFKLLLSNYNKYTKKKECSSSIIFIRITTEKLLNVCG